MSNQPKVPVSDTIKLKDLQKLLSCEAHRWLELGFQLKIPNDELKKIESNVRRTPTDCFRDVVEWWLKNTSDEQRKWKVIFEALEDINKKRLMRTLQTKYSPDITVDKNAGLELVNLLKDAVPDWYIFGQSLEVPRAELKAFKEDKGIDQCFSDMLDTWLDNEATWNDLVEALEHVGNKVLAREVENKYIKATIALEPQQTEPLWYAGLDESTLTEEDDYFDVLKEINTVTKWEELGLALKIKSHKIDEIRKENREIAECRRRMLVCWFREGLASWMSLCLALDHDVVGERHLARRIARNIKGTQQHPKPLPLPITVESNNDGDKMVGNEGTMTSPEICNNPHDDHIQKAYRSNSSGTSYMDTTYSGTSGSTGNTSYQQVSTSQSPSEPMDIHREESQNMFPKPTETSPMEGQFNPEHGYHNLPGNQTPLSSNSTIYQQSSRSSEGMETQSSVENINHPSTVENATLAYAYYPHGHQMSRSRVDYITGLSTSNPTTTNLQSHDSGSGTIQFPSPSPQNLHPVPKSKPPPPQQMKIEKEKSREPNIPYPQSVESLGTSHALNPNKIGHPNSPQPMEIEERSEPNIPHPQSVESLGTSRAMNPNKRGHPNATIHVDPHVHPVQMTVPQESSSSQSPLPSAPPQSEMVGGMGYEGYHVINSTSAYANTGITEHDDNTDNPLNNNY